MRLSKKFVAVIMSIVMVALCCPLAFAADTAQLYNIYQDNMLFKQNDEAIFNGTAPSDTVIGVSLFNSKNVKIAESSSVADTDGTFSVSFVSPAGSYEEYTVVLTSNGKEFRKLKNVVFGELWLASGQSNMQYPLSQAKTSAEDFRNNVKQSKWIRALLVPPYPEYKGSASLVPLEPQADIIGAQWVNGENPAIYSMSAVGFFFAEELQKELDMPIGILNAALGGSTIRSWLSREAIDACPEVKDYLTAKGEYFSESGWKENEQSVYYDMTANFNGKISPLTSFRPSGIIWYQGETDLITENAQYDKQLDLLQKSYTEYFSYDNGLLPIIYTHIAAYKYQENTNVLADWNMLYDKIQQEQPLSRAVTTIYDVPLTFLPEVGVIHPESKEEVGDRMAFAAMGLVYDRYESYTSATVKSYRIENSSIYVTFENAGDGLLCEQKSIKGFAISSADNIFVEAKAEIISEDTVKLYADGVSSPDAFSYAYCLDNGEANLYASLDGEKTLPVSPFISKKTSNDHYWSMPSFVACDTQKVWYTHSNTFSGYYDLWTAQKAEISVTDASAVTEKGLKINASAKSFSISPVTTYKDGLLQKNFVSFDGDFSDYGTISFYVRNDGNAEIVFTELRFYESDALWYTPAVEGTYDVEYTIPADGQWHKITLDLGRVYHLGNECSLSYNNEKLGKIRNIEFRFSSPEKNASLSFDSISFTPSAIDAKTRYDVELSNADNPMEFFTGLVLYIFGKFISLFNI